MTPEEEKAALKARSLRNWVIAGALVAFVVLVFVTTIVRLGGNVANRPL